MTDTNPVVVREQDLVCKYPRQGFRFIRINLNIDGTPITSKSHTHPSHS
jgi:hypothetical protein